MQEKRFTQARDMLNEVFFYAKMSNIPVAKVVTCSVYFKHRQCILACVGHHGIISDRQSILNWETQKQQLMILMLLVESLKVFQMLM